MGLVQALLEGLDGLGRVPQLGIDLAQLEHDLPGRVLVAAQLQIHGLEQDHGPIIVALDGHCDLGQTIPGLLAELALGLHLQIALVVLFRLEVEPLGIGIARPLDILLAGRRRRRAGRDGKHRRGQQYQYE